ncbi:TetR/AcrR family transcriptional regulator [Amycolatopsis suaedae]|uniref:TetR/AcrR family transcriptional regulator n=1 Tax=Amycolatopsis suaedae TaxID=2510978 RepID=A0A4Q7IYM8_9PSEU|nr:TetR/AcrR family transcriptional regulator [Amycolatopsis suaedae]RZQ59547.1 TetR/AcrR family transcriptional regulator [Amycolatopsis suaedae]
MTEPKPLRADARRNRERVLAAAREAFASDGLAVPLDEIARRAGVGAGTVYRHFPTKEALFEAIVVDNLRVMADQARTQLDAADPGAALIGVLHYMVERGSGNRALFEALNQAGSDSTARVGAEVLDVLGDLLARAQAAGRIRPDLTARQVKAMLVGLNAAVEWLGDVTAEERRLLVDLVCDGLATH